MCHLIDVASMASALWRESVPLRPRMLVAHFLGLGVDEAEPWIVFFAGLHDLGKATPGFQSKRAESKALLLEYGLRIPTGVKPDPHGILGTKILSEIFSEDAAWNLAGPVGRRIATAVAGHHGLFARPDQWVYLANSQLGDAGWREQQRALVSLLFEFANPQGSPLGRALAETDPAAILVLAGLTSVADWIGSSVEFFPYRGSIDRDELVAYSLGAVDKVEKALTETGWRSQPFSCTRPVCFNMVFPGLRPRPLQEAAAMLVEGWRGPGLVIVEAPMGEGKTEAAWFLHRASAAAAGGEGCYVALPTQATSNQMFTRVRDFLGSQFEGVRVNLQLLHGQAGLSSDFRHLRVAAIMDELAASPESAAVVAEEWFTPKKRGLLAPYAVGTIDQALLAVLRTKHSFVRLFGLAGKTLIIDEVHAYDTYMSTLLDRLLEWAAAMSLSVVLLSATLPSGRRGQLLAAYSGDRRAPPPAAYPRLSWVDSRGAGATGFDARTQTSLSLGWVGSDIATVAQSLIERLGEGGCAAWICNTVDRAQRVYRHLRELELADTTLRLFHARYPFSERCDRERWVLQAFGPTDQQEMSPRPRRAILVATQVVEQSLDLDFDLMISDLAPVDLLLQRAGRLHRHARRRPSALALPQLWILGPTEIDSAADVRKIAPVYDEYVLLRSLLALQHKEVIRLPQDIEPLVEAVYGDDCLPEDLTASLALRLADARAAREVQRLHEQAEAIKRVIPSPREEDDVTEDFSGLLEEDAAEMHLSLQALTRLSEPTVAVVFLHRSGDSIALDPAGRNPVRTWSRHREWIRRLDYGGRR